ncbi:MAG: hypothetical protein ACXW4Q_05170, partial [Anaerolineales bacterium]
MLSKYSRTLTYACAVFYASVGILLFFFPGRFTGAFAYKVTPFMMMTIGAWDIGNAWLAYISARRWDWQLVSSSLLYLWLFGIIECIVLYLFRTEIKLTQFISQLYVLTLGVNFITALVGIVDWLRSRPILKAEEAQIPRLFRILPLGAVLFTGSLGLYGLLVPFDGFGTNGEVFPEPLFPLVLRAFAAFYFSLGLAVIPLVRVPNLRLFLTHVYSAMGFIVAITIAALVYIRLFDFGKHPLGLGYIGAYVA